MKSFRWVLLYYLIRPVMKRVHYLGFVLCYIFSNNFSLSKYHTANLGISAEKNYILSTVWE